MEESFMDEFKLNFSNEFLKKVVDHYLQKEEAKLKRFFPKERLQQLRNSWFSVVPDYQRIVASVQEQRPIPYIPRVEFLERDIRRLEQTVGGEDSQSGRRVKTGRHTQQLSHFQQRLEDLKRLRTRTARLNLIYTLKRVVADLEPLINSGLMAPFAQPHPNYDKSFGNEDMDEDTINALKHGCKLVLTVMYDWAISLSSVPLSDSPGEEPPEEHAGMEEMLDEKVAPTEREIDFIINDSVGKALKDLQSRGEFKGLNRQELERRARQVSHEILKQADEFGETKAQRGQIEDKTTTRRVDESKYTAGISNLLRQLSRVRAGTGDKFVFVPTAGEFIALVRNYRTEETQRKMIPRPSNYVAVRADAQEKTEYFGGLCQEPGLDAATEQSYEEMMSRYLFNGEELERLDTLEDQVILVKQLIVIVIEVTAIFKDIKANKQNRVLQQLVRELGPELGQWSPQWIKTLDKAIQDLMLITYEWTANACLIGGVCTPPKSDTIVTTKTDTTTRPRYPPLRPTAQRRSDRSDPPASEMRQEIDQIVNWGPNSAIFNSLMSERGIFRHGMPNYKQIAQHLITGQHMSRIHPPFPTVENYFSELIDTSLVDFLTTVKGRVCIVKDLLGVIDDLKRLETTLSQGQVPRVPRWDLTPNDIEHILVGMPAAIQYVERLAWRWARAIESAQGENITPVSPVRRRTLK